MLLGIAELEDILIIHLFQQLNNYKYLQYLNTDHWPSPWLTLLLFYSEEENQAAEKKQGPYDQSWS